MAIPQTFAASPNATVTLVALAGDVDCSRLRFDRVIFLDFDGVLHPEAGDPAMHFCYSPNFAEVLEFVAPKGDVPVVISSTWRLTSTLAEMREHFPEKIRKQIVGVTPDLDAIWEPKANCNRQSEIEAWMGQISPAGKWLAIDDRPSLFNPGCASLFHVPSYRPGLGAGLNGQVSEDLKEAMARFLAPAVS